MGFTVGPLENGTLRAAKWMHRDPFQKEKEKGTLIKGSQVDSQKVPKKGLLWKQTENPNFPPQKDPSRLQCGIYAGNECSLSLSARFSGMGNSDSLPPFSKVLDLPRLIA